MQFPNRAALFSSGPDRIVDSAVITIQTLSHIGWTSSPWEFAHEYSTSAVLGGVLGAEVVGFDPAASHPKTTWEELRSATMEQCLLLFRGDALSGPQLVDFAGALGPVMKHVSANSSKFVLPEAPDVHLISSGPGGARYAGQAWHSDYAYIEDPAQLSCFYMRKTPVWAAIPLLPTCMPPMMHCRLG